MSGAIAICRPGSDGRHRTKHVGTEGRDRVLENARWRGQDGLVHQASRHHNQTLCEMGSARYAELLHLGSMAFTRDHVTCVACVAYVTWHEYPTE